SPSRWPVASAEALGVVGVGKSAWLFAKNTPSARTLARAGGSVALTEPARRPSATKMTAFLATDAPGTRNARIPRATAPQAWRTSRATLPPGLAGSGGEGCSTRSFLMMALTWVTAIPTPPGLSSKKIDVEQGTVAKKSIRDGDPVPAGQG